MDRVLATAAHAGAELVLANDPDADRLAAAVPLLGGGYRLLSGNETGALLADDAMEHARAGRKKLVVTTVVSSSLLSRMARDRGVAYRETLTGFKWICDAALRAERDEGLQFVFGYEEALGYTVGTLVRDKDGIGAAVRLAEAARALKARGVTLLERLDDLLVAHGLSHQVQWSATLPGAEGRARIAAAMETLRRVPPARLGASPVARVLDAERGEERVAGETRPSLLPRSDVMQFQTEDGSRLTVRPSGTEPKIKFYLELTGQAASRADVAPARARLDADAKAMKAALLAELKLA
jgi:phosphomannomutase